VKILVDIDGIVADTLPYWLDRIHEEAAKWFPRDVYGLRPAQVGDIDQWGLENCGSLKVIHKLAPQIIFGLLNKPGFMAGIPIMPGAAQTLKQLMDDSHEVLLVTARHGPVNMAETLEWVKLHLPFINAEKQLIFCYRKELIPADVLIDDKPETLNRYALAHPSALLMTINYAYNAQALNVNTVPVKTVRFQGHPNLNNTWGAIYGYIRGYEDRHGN